MQMSSETQNITIYAYLNNNTHYIVPIRGKFIPPIGQLSIHTYDL